MTFFELKEWLEMLSFFISQRNTLLIDIKCNLQFFVEIYLLFFFNNLYKILRKLLIATITITVDIWKELFFNDIFLKGKNPQWLFGIMLFALHYI